MEPWSQAHGAMEPSPWSHGVKSMVGSLALPLRGHGLSGLMYEAPEAPPGDDPPLYHVLRIGVADVYRHVGQLCLMSFCTKTR